MTSRRQFVRSVVAAAAGASAVPGAAALAWQSASRRQVMLGNRRIRVIDAHAHCIIPVTDIVKSTPLAQLGGGGGNNVLCLLYTSDAADE